MVRPWAGRGYQGRVVCAAIPGGRRAWALAAMNDNAGVLDPDQGFKCREVPNASGQRGRPSVKPGGQDRSTFVAGGPGRF